jgi:hypothetical protein
VARLDLVELLEPFEIAMDRFFRVLQRFLDGVTLGEAAIECRDGDGESPLLGRLKHDLEFHRNLREWFPMFYHGAHFGGSVAAAGDTRNCFFNGSKMPKWLKF